MRKFPSFLIGVAVRLVEFGALRMVHPLVSAHLAALLHPIGAVILGLIGSPSEMPRRLVTQISA